MGCRQPTPQPPLATHKATPHPTGPHKATRPAGGGQAEAACPATADGRQAEGSREAVAAGRTRVVAGSV